MAKFEQKFKMAIAYNILIIWTWAVLARTEPLLATTFKLKMSYALKLWLNHSFKNLATYTIMIFPCKMID